MREKEILGSIEGKLPSSPQLCFIMYDIGTRLA